MDLPRWLARMNKHVANPLEIRRGVRPVLTHVGRTSGRTYRTPLDAHPLPNGYVFIPMYGPRTDWVKNVLTAGTARLSSAATSSSWSHRSWCGSATSGRCYRRTPRHHRASPTTPNCCAWTSDRTTPTDLNVMAATPASPPVLTE
jgi:hypothetical protein